MYAPSTPVPYLPPPTGSRFTPPPPPPAPAAPPTAAPYAPVAGRTPVAVPPRVLALAASAAVFCVATALPWYHFRADSSGAGFDWSGWTRSMFSPFVPLAAVGMGAVAVLALLAVFGSRPLPARVLGFDWNQVRLLVAGYSTIVVAAYLVMSRDWTTNGLSLGTGYWVALLGVLTYDLTLALEGRVLPVLQVSSPASSSSGS